MAGFINLFILIQWFVQIDKYHLSPLNSISFGRVVKNFCPLLEVGRGVMAKDDSGTLLKRL